MELVRRTIERYVRLHDADWSRIGPCWREFACSKQAFISRMGEVEDQFYIVKSGVQRMSFPHDGEDVCVGFSYDGSWLASFGTNHIINPFERFSEHLALAMVAPERFRLIELLTSLPETPLPEDHRPPIGEWILCGYGTFGHALEKRLASTGVQLRIIDPSLQTEGRHIAVWAPKLPPCNKPGLKAPRASWPVATMM